MTSDGHNPAFFVLRVRERPQKIDERMIQMALTEKEKLFCIYFSESRNARSAAANSGYGLLAQRSGLKLLRRKDIRSEIERIDKTKLVCTEEIAAGYRQLAFGSVADALKLVYAENNPEGIALEKLDMFNVSEIKRPKGGGIEIKFFDRMKALEHLEALSNGDGKESTALPFYTALEKSAKALGDTDE